MSPVAPAVNAHTSPRSRGHIVAFVILAALPVLILASLYIPSFAVWPEAWVLPATAWLGEWIGGLLAFLKPFARLVSGLLSYPMAAAHFVLTELSWTIVMGAFVAIAWWVGRLRMAVATWVALTFILLSGYWQESMATLSLVAVSVPLALILGLAIGIAAHEYPVIRKPVEVVLDVMQTVPTFAYLTPLLVLFGFGPVVGLIASAIYAAPPMTRNTLLGLRRIEPDITEAVAMAGASFWQRLLWVDLPAASHQILIGVNQCIMAALSMVIIAAVIGGFDDIGWEVLLTMRKAQFGQALLAGLVIVVFAIIIDRLSAGMAEDAERGDSRVMMYLLIAGMASALVIWMSGLGRHPSEFALLVPVADAVDNALSQFTSTYGAALDQLKNNAMFYLLLPLRIGLDHAVLPFTWGFNWTQSMSLGFASLCLVPAALLVRYGRLGLAMTLICLAGIIHTGLTHVPWPIVIVVVSGLAWHAGGRSLALFTALSLFLILIIGLWDRAMLSLYLCAAAVFLCAMIGGLLGLLAARSPLAWRVLQPVCDMLQTIPLFVFLIPMLMFFQIGEFSALLAICAYAIVPMIRYTRHGLLETPSDLIESATASGATEWQILRDIRFPYAMPTLLLGLNQTILYAFAMLVIAALIGTTGLGQSIYLALGKADIGLGVASGTAMALLALIADRIVQAYAAGQRQALGLD